MTTPRDDIAGLSERLRFDAVRCELHFSKGVASNIEAAATQLDALSARVKELESDRDRWKYSYHDLIKGTKAIADRALRAEQERDEAYERAASIAENPPKPEGRGHACIATGRLIAAAIRRLASGPEKEKKE